MPPFKPTPSQELAISSVKSFLSGGATCFLLKGSAGTGKTTIIANVLEYLASIHRANQPVAPTGRSARILGSKTRSSANTIHRAIYSLGDVEVFEEAQSENDPGIRFVYPLKQDDPADTVFIVDEASMVGDKETKGDVLQFGSGRLLADLIQFARLGRPGRDTLHGAKIIFVGDPAQLLPVGETLSPALSATYLKQTFGLDCLEHELKEVMRQAQGSAVLERATSLRDAIGKKLFNIFELSPAKGEVEATTIPEAVSLVVDAFRNKASSVFITHSNAQALQLNQSVRGRLWGDENVDLRVGDLLLVNKNSAKTGLSNGDLVKVVGVTSQSDRRSIRIKGVEHPVELAFRQVFVAYRDANWQTIRIDAKVLENLLRSPERDLSPIQQRALLVDFRLRNPHLKPKSAEFRLAIRQDEYFNALQVKYGYAMTCHKAQGGEWDTAVVDFGDGRGKRNEEFFRWAYTAITRAKKKLVTINAPRFDAMSTLNWGDVGQQKALDNKPTPPDLDQDADWNRFSFNRGQERLFEYHLALREAWASSEIVIEGLDHMQYCERYRVTREGKRASVQYHYKGNQTVSKTGATPGQLSDHDLVGDALTVMGKAMQSGVSTSSSLNDPFLSTFKDKVAEAIADTEIRLLSATSMQYRLRMDFEWQGHHVKIDFHYDGTPKWIRVEEVGGQGRAGACLRA